MHEAPTRSQRFAPRVLSVARLVAVATIACVFRVVPVCADEPARAELERWVRLLASPDLEGRRGEGGRKAAGAIVEEFRRLGLKPLFDGQYVQEIPPAPPADTLGRNVGAILPGSDPELAAHYVIVSAHYDHLGVRGGVLYPGADDNASGVAMMLESARCLAGAQEKPRRSVVFIAFDQEEAGLYGSRYFVAHPPFAVEKIDLFVTADMIGRSLGGVCGEFFFVMGTEHVPALRSWLTEAVGGRPLRMGILGADLLVLNRSDYGPFRSNKVPFLFFSTGENPRYHSPSDTPETLDYPKMTEISRVIHGVVARAATAPTLPEWSDQTDNPVEEALTIREVLKTLEAHREALKLNAAQGYLIDGALKTLEGVAARGTITPAERSSLLRAARLVLMTAF